MSLYFRLTLICATVVVAMEKPALGQVGASGAEGVARVTHVHVARDETRRVAGLGDEIAVVVENLDLLLREDRPIRLYVDDRVVPELQAEIGRGRLYFGLVRHDDAEGFWIRSFGRPRFGATFFEVPVKVSVGVEGGEPIESDVMADSGERGFSLRRIGKWEFAGGLLFLLLLTIVVWRLARESNMIRDREASGLAKLQAELSFHGPYSLARTQMMVWFVLVIGSFVFIWIVTGNANTITASVLGLIGIGSGTALGAAMVESGKEDPREATLQELSEQQRKVENEMGAADRGEEETAGVRREGLGGQASELAKQMNALVPRSESFARDLLTDVNGVNIHRFQMMVWTVVLVVVFVHSVWSRLSMPEFSATLLALQGISGGTYLGFKIPEQQA